MCIAFDVINFEINLFFLTKPFLSVTKMLKQKFKYLEKEKSEIKRIIYHFLSAFSCQKLSQTRECVSNISFTRISASLCKRVQICAKNTGGMYSQCVCF